VQGYQGPAKWDWIKACRQEAKNILIIGNGDVFSAEAGEKMFKEVGCDAILVARGTLGQPWIADDIYRRLEGKPEIKRTLEDYRSALYDHFIYTLGYQNDRKTLVDMRRVGCWYFKKASGTRAFRQSISKATSVEEVRDLILHFPLGDLIEGEENDESCESSC
jgi:tRNA-dihydrouridine synthase